MPVSSGDLDETRKLVETFQALAEILYPDQKKALPASTHLAFIGFSPDFWTITWRWVGLRVSRSRTGRGVQLPEGPVECGEIVDRLEVA